jgi:glycosyltransferase involved in cell wall biosynthesis
LLEAAAILKQKGRSDIKILLIGEGQQREQLEQSAAERGIDNFIRWGLIPKHELVAFIQNALVSLVPLHGTPVLDTSSPNKFFESLAAGVPVIQNTNGWMKTFLEETQTGLTLSPNDPEALANALIDWDAHPENVRAMGQRALTVARQEFDKTVLADKMLKALIQVHQSK